MSTKVKTVLTLSPVAQSFVIALNEYCDIAARNFRRPICENGEDTRPASKKVLRLFKQCPDEERYKLLFTALYTVSKTATASSWHEGFIPPLKIDWKIFSDKLYWGEENLIDELVKIIGGASLV